MNANNPRYVLRNYIAQYAITAAEKGDFSEVWQVFKILEDPFGDELTPEKLAKETNTDIESCKIILEKFASKAPQSACELRVSCSS